MSIVKITDNIVYYKGSKAPTTDDVLEFRTRHNLPPFKNTYGSVEVAGSEIGDIMRVRHPALDAPISTTKYNEQISATKHDGGKEFKKNDMGKLEWNLMPEEALEEVLKVLMLGKKKYGAFNWIDNAAANPHSRIANALERHLKSYKKGGNLDKESGLHEMAHIACNALFLLQYYLENVGIDDRRKNEDS